MARLRAFLVRPFLDFQGGLQHALPDPPWVSLAAVFVGFVVCWWVYVPVHELLHAFGCLATGGSVDRLEIDPYYGAALLKKVFPFVEVGSEYAGQLTGFDTYGNDLTYLATVFAPFLLSVYPGVWWLRRTARGERTGPGRSFLFGASLPVAFAPFTNVMGDYYEMGSIVVSRLARPLLPQIPLERWRSDDLIKTVDELLLQGPFHFADLAGITAGALLGVVLAFATYGAGLLVARLLER